MKYNKKEAILLKDRWIINAQEVPNARALEMVETEEGGYEPAPFPLSLDAQRKLLELIYNRKSGIITRQELIRVLFGSEDPQPDIKFRPLF